MRKFVLQLFTWWNGATLNTRFHTWRRGAYVGEDEFGNVYFQGGFDSEGRMRRWVIYKGDIEASTVPSGWHGWLHHRINAQPSDQEYKPYGWQKPHEPNLTGTSAAYRPRGSMMTSGERPRVTGDYDSWIPG